MMWIEMVYMLLIVDIHIGIECADNLQLITIATVFAIALWIVFLIRFELAVGKSHWYIGRWKCH